MKSDFVKKIILLKQMLDDMEQDIGLSSLSGVEKNVYLAAQASKSQDGLVQTKQILKHSFTQKMSRPTFFRALKSIEKKVSNVQFLFVGANDKMEMQKVPQAGYTIKGLWISGIQRRFTFKNLLFPFKVLNSLFKSIGIINTFKPDIVIGTGGFASGPLLLVAALKGVSTLIQEQNSFPGITNKLLSKKVNKICVAYEGLERFFSKEKLLLSICEIQS